MICRSARVSTNVEDVRIQTRSVIRCNRTASHQRLGKTHTYAASAEHTYRAAHQSLAAARHRQGRPRRPGH